jgi:DNA-binding IclR family transcriptional regulator
MKMSEKQDHNVQSLDRAFAILESLASEQEGLGVTEIGTRVDLHKSTVHRLLSTMLEKGYVDKKDNGAYHIGLKLIEVVSVYLNSLELQTEARPYIAQISTDLGLTAHLGVLEGDQVIYIERMDMHSSGKLYAQIGQRMEAYCSSLGKCLLSNFSRNEVDIIMQNCRFEKFTPNTIASMDELHEELKNVRKSGYGIDDREFNLNNRCIGAPIYDYRGEIIAAISASGPPNFFTKGKIPEVASYVIERAREISRNMGYLE